MKNIVPSLLLFAVVAGVVLNVPLHLDMDRVVLGNGDKTVVYESMVHIATPEFYEDVKDDIAKLKGDGAVHFYEGVKGGAAISADVTNLISRGQFDGIELGRLYTDVAEMAGLVTQSSFENDIVGPGDVNADIDGATLLGIMRTHPESPDAPRPVLTQGGLDKFMEWIRSKPAWVRRVVSTLIRDKMASVGNAVDEQGVPYRSAIMDTRTGILADRILASTSKEIVVTYGGGHLSGLLRRLVDRDPAWHVVETRSRRAF